MKKFLLMMCALALVCIGETAQAKSPRHNTEKAEGAKATDVVADILDVVANIPKLGPVSYGASGIRIIDACGQFKSAHTTYMRTHEKLRTTVAFEDVNNKQRECEKSFWFSVPALGDVLYIFEGIYENKPIRVVCGLISLVTTIVSTGTSTVLPIAGGICAIISLVETLEAGVNDGSRGSSKWRPEDVFHMASANGG